PALDHSAGISVGFSGTTLSIAVQELTNPAMGTYDVYMENGDYTMIQRYEIVGINTSALEYEEKAYSMVQNQDGLIDLSDDQDVWRFLVDLAYLKEVITPEDRDEIFLEFNPEDSAAYGEVVSSLASVANTYSQYVDGLETEHGLAQSVEAAEFMLVEHAKYGLDRFRLIESLSDDVMSRLPSDDLAFDEKRGKFSRFFAASMIEVNAASGAEVYKDGFKILTPLTGL
ncbi:hypothetical protein, partial [Marinobacter sp.]|uniref:hypothetical protein n=1 Tax=Marinobacter sp. TaxID=50741 RepID=UPI003A8ECA57